MPTAVTTTASTSSPTGASSVGAATSGTSRAAAAGRGSGRASDSRGRVASRAVSWALASSISSTAAYRGVCTGSCRPRSRRRGGSVATEASGRAASSYRGVPISGSSSRRVTTADGAHVCRGRRRGRCRAGRRGSVSSGILFSDGTSYAVSSESRPMTSAPFSPPSFPRLSRGSEETHACGGGLLSRRRGIVGREIIIRISHIKGKAPVYMAIIKITFS